MKNSSRDNLSQTADSRQQTADSRQQTADSRQQTADSANSVKFFGDSNFVAANSAKIRRQHCMHGGKFSRSLRLGATVFARVYGEGFCENRKNFARNCREKFLQNCGKSANLADLDRGGATDSAKLYIEKFRKVFAKLRKIRQIFSQRKK